MSGYDFSQLYHSSILAYSPGTTFIATAHQNRIIVRTATTLQIVRTWLCTPSTPVASSSKSTGEFTIDTLQWSEDGSYLLVLGMGTVWIFALAEEGSGASGEVTMIREGIDGCVKVEWGKGGREVLVWSEHGVKLSIYDLVTGSSPVIQYPKSHNNCHAYSPDSRYLAVAERHSGKEYVGVYDVGLEYQLLRHFPIETTDVAGLSWSPCGRYLAVHESSLQYSAYIYSPLGPLLSHFSPSSPSFAVGKAEDPGLGIRVVTWGSGGRWLALGGWDNKVRILESAGWRCVAVMGWGSRVTEPDTAVWKEPATWIEDTKGRGIVQFDRTPVPIGLPTIRPDLAKYPPRAGISQLAFDAQGTLFCARSDSTPNVIHIHTFLPDPTAYDPEITHLATLVFSNPVKTAKWSKGKGKRLLVATRSGAVYVWDGETDWVEDGQEVHGGLMEGVGIPAWTDFAAHDLVAAPDGSSVAILDKGQFCMLYETDAEESMTRPGGIVADEGLSHVMEEEEDWEADQASFLSSNLDAVLAA